MHFYCIKHQTFPANNFATWLNSKLSFSWDSVNIGGKEIIQAGNINLGKIPTFATGGFPEDGLFFANHGEMVGQFSNGNTAVANNSQIVEGIKAGVKSAVSEALTPYLSQIAQNTSENSGIKVELDGNGRVKQEEHREIQFQYFSDKYRRLW